MWGEQLLMSVGGLCVCDSHEDRVRFKADSACMVRKLSVWQRIILASQTIKVIVPTWRLNSKIEGGGLREVGSVQTRLESTQDGANPLKIDFVVAAE